MCTKQKIENADELLSEYLIARKSENQSSAAKSILYILYITAPNIPHTTFTQP